MLLATLLAAIHSQADQQGTYNQARDKALEAFYWQSGAKKDVDEFSKQFEGYAKKLDAKYVPDYLHTPGGVMFFILKAIHEQKLYCEWRF